MILVSRRSFINDSVPPADFVHRAAALEKYHDVSAVPGMISSEREGIV